MGHLCGGVTLKSGMLLILGFYFGRNRSGDQAA